jgi:glycosyltransferase involved in cell wall biosynthesis
VVADRVVYVTARFPFGPGEAFVIPELRALAGMGFDVLLVPVLPSGPIVHPDAAEFVARTRAASLVSPRVLRGAARAILRHPGRSARAALRAIAGQRPRIVAKNLAVIPKGLWLADLVAREGVSNIHAYWASTAGTVAFVASTVSGVRMSMTAHSWDIGEANALEAKVDRSVVTRVISIDGRSELLGRISASAAPRVQLLHLGVAIPEDVPVQSVAPALRVVVPAAFEPFKGHAALIDAARLLKADGVEVRFQLVGDGPLRKAVEAAVIRAGVDGMVVFAGQMAHTELLARYDAGAVDAVVLPSVTQTDGSREGIPISLVEAMARSIPVIGTTCGGVPELLANGAGILVPEGQPAALADAVALLCREPALRHALGAAGRARVQADFDSDRQTSRLCAAAGIVATVG